MTLGDYIRALGIRRGLRWWWVAKRFARNVRPQFTVHHGAKPSMPGYRRRARRS